MRVAVEADGAVTVTGDPVGAPLGVAAALCRALHDVVGSAFQVVGARVLPVVDTRVAFVSMVERSPRETTLLTGVASGDGDGDAVVDAVLHAAFDDDARPNVLCAGAARLVRDGDADAAVVVFDGMERREFGDAREIDRLEQLSTSIPAAGRLVVQTAARPYRALSTGTARLAIALADRDGAADRVDRWWDGVSGTR
jgi:hypothetical protein